MIAKVLLEFGNFMSDHFSKYFDIHDFIWFPDLPVREIRSSLFYKWGAEPHRDWLVCAKSPWICIRACVTLSLSFSGSLFLSLGCLPRCLLCSQKCWHLEILWIPSSWVGPTACTKETPAVTPHPKSVPVAGEEIDEITRPRRRSCWLQIILLSLVKSETRLRREPAHWPQWFPFV